jgi:hypothetical protein
LQPCHECEIAVVDVETTGFAAQHTDRIVEIAIVRLSPGHTMLKTAYNWGLEEELLLVNPALRVKNPPALRPKTRPVWSMGEIASTVIKARGLQVHAAGVLAGYSGLRAQRIASLQGPPLPQHRGGRRTQFRTRRRKVHWLTNGRGQSQSSATRRIR